MFEGRDTAGKGGTIKRITERVSLRAFRVVALAGLMVVESKMYIQRYLPHFPAAGEVVIFDRSWYNRAGVEPGQATYAGRTKPPVARALVPNMDSTPRPWSDTATAIFPCGEAPGASPTQG